MQQQLQVGDKVSKIYCGGSYPVTVIQVDFTKKINQVRVQDEEGKKHWTTPDYLISKE